jgi:hypothetical protein
MSCASELAHRLGQEAEAVCHAYLPAGKRHGHYWHCGNVHGDPGQSLYVHLSGPRSGHWTDGATSERGDMLDLIALNQGIDLRGAIHEARRFLNIPGAIRTIRRPAVPCGSLDAARRLFAASKPIRGTLAETYLRNRGIVLPSNLSALRFHPHCYYRGSTGREVWPALIGAVTDNAGTITGVHRTWLDPAGGKAPVENPRRALGELLGNGVRFGNIDAVVAVAEGIETALALNTVLPAMPVIAALSAAHLAALILPPTIRRLYVARDNDMAGRLALERLRERFWPSDLDLRALVPQADDFNTDLLVLGKDRLGAWIKECLVPDDCHFLSSSGLPAKRHGGFGENTAGRKGGIMAGTSLVGRATAFP